MPIEEPGYYSFYKCGGGNVKTTHAVALACIAIILVGCGGLTKGKAASEVAIDHFHQQYSDGKFEEIWKEAHSKFQSASTKEKYTEFMSTVQRKLGKVKSTSNAGWKVNTFNLITTVLMTQETIFEEGKGTESFTFEMDGEKAVLVGYNIQSMDLIMK
jgi:hypothetical protein